GALRQDHAVERRADLRVVDGDLGVARRRPRSGDLRLRARHPRGRPVDARLRRIERRSRDEIAVDELLVALQLDARVGFLDLRLVDAGARRLDVGLRGTRLRDDVTVVEARDHLALLDARALSDAEPFEAAGRLRRDRRLALRDDVAGGIEHDELLRRVRG